MKKPRHAPEQARFGGAEADAREVFAAEMSEAELQARVEEMARALGYLVYHTRDARHSEAGFPDLVMLRPRDGRLIFAELKSEKGKLSDAQRAWYAGLKKHQWALFGWISLEVPRLTQRQIEQRLMKACAVAWWKPSQWYDGTIEKDLR